MTIPINEQAEKFTINTTDGLLLQGYRWVPASSPEALVFIVHGLGDHGSRYAEIADRLIAKNYMVIAYDQRGHGESTNHYGDFSSAAWLGMLADLIQVISENRANHPDLPVILLGHSMGSMLSHHLLTVQGSLVDAAVLSGSPGFASKLQTWLLLMITRFESWRLGHQGHSKLIHNLLFGSANNAFETEQSTGFEWLSRDQEQVDRYVADPACGFVPTAGSTFQWFSGYRDATSREAIAKIPKQIPLYLFSGSADPIHNNLKNINRQLSAYRDAGLKVQTRFYPAGRHEMLNEINRDEVMDDLIQWLHPLIQPPQA